MNDTIPKYSKIVFKKWELVISTELKIFLLRVYFQIRITLTEDFNTEINCVGHEEYVFQ